MEHYFLAIDIIAVAEASKAETVLTVSLSYAFKFLNVVASPTVVRICTKDTKRFFVRLGKRTWMPLAESSSQTVKS